SLSVLFSVSRSVVVHSCSVSHTTLLVILFFFSGSGSHRHLHSFPTRRSSDLGPGLVLGHHARQPAGIETGAARDLAPGQGRARRSEEHTSELQSRENLVCRLLLEKKKQINQHLPNIALTPQDVR